MTRLSAKKKKAIELREQGWSYNQIIEKVPVALSTLSYWLRDIKLSPEAELALIEAEEIGRKKGVLIAQKQYRDKRRELFAESSLEFDSIELTKDGLSLVGAALYWAEGSKGRKGGLSFANSDPAMITIYARWLREILGITTPEITCRVSVHIDDTISYEEVEIFWSGIIGIPRTAFMKPLIKSTEGKKKGKHPWGCVSVRVRKPLKYRAKYAALVGKLGCDDEFI